MRNCDDYSGAVEQHAMQKRSRPDRKSAPMSPDMRELFGLELNVRDFVLVNLLANRSQQPRFRGGTERWVVNFRDYFSGDEDCERDFQAANDVAQPAKDLIAESPLYLGNAVHFHKASQHRRMSLFLRDEHSDGFGVCRI